MSIFKFYCEKCDTEFEKDSDEFFVSYANVLETKCPNCNSEVNNLHTKGEILLKRIDK